MKSNVVQSTAWQSAKTFPFSLFLNPTVRVIWDLKNMRDHFRRVCLSLVPAPCAFAAINHNRKTTAFRTGWWSGAGAAPLPRLVVNIWHNIARVSGAHVDINNLVGKFQHFAFQEIFIPREAFSSCVKGGRQSVTLWCKITPSKVMSREKKSKTNNQKFKWFVNKNKTNRRDLHGLAPRHDCVMQIRFGWPNGDRGLEFESETQACSSLAGRERDP